MALAAAGAAGIVLADFDVAGVRHWALAASLVMLVSVLVYPRRWLLLLTCGFAFAALHEAQLKTSFNHPLRLHLLAEGKAMTAVVEGSLTPDHASSTPVSLRAICEATRVTLEDGSEWPLRTRLKVLLSSDDAFPGPGTYRIRGLLRLPATQHAPGTFDPADHALRSGFAAELRVSALEKISDEGATWTCAMLNAAEESRRWISERRFLHALNEGLERGLVVDRGGDARQALRLEGARVARGGLLLDHRGCRPRLGEARRGGDQRN